jgi:hypothetical protein
LTKDRNPIATTISLKQGAGEMKVESFSH